MKNLCIFLALSMTVGLARGSCNDMDAIACGMLLKARPNMCQETCYKSVCPKTCNSCPLVCNTCHEVNNPANCSTSVECPSSDYWCAVTETLNDNFEKVFKLGCSTKQHCADFFGTTLTSTGLAQGIIGRKKRVGGTLEGECCDKDRCNNDLPSNLPPISLQTPTTVAPSTSNSAPNTTCDDTDSDACTYLALAATNGDPCSNECIAKTICPRLCGNCVTCYDCPQVLSPEDCNNSRNCDVGERCYTLETFTSSFDKEFRVGCLKKEVCEKFTSVSHGEFGRRDDLIISLSGGCCNTDHCNDHALHLTTTTTTTTTTPKPTTTQPLPTVNIPNLPCIGIYHTCPQGYTQIGRSCYVVDPYRREDWIHAKQYCNSKCSDLASFDNENTLIYVANAIISKLPGLPPQFYVDAIVGQNQLFQWASSNAPVSPQLSSSQHSPNTCGYVAPTRTGWGLFGDNCNIQRSFLCEIKLS